MNARYLIVSVAIGVTIACTADGVRTRSAGQSPGSASGPTPVGDPSPTRFPIAVTDDGFEPKSINVSRGQQTTLVFTRWTEKTCLKEVVVYLDDHQTVRRTLPFGKPVVLTVTFTRSGSSAMPAGWACMAGRSG
jgi:hypothetical protein